MERLAPPVGYPYTITGSLESGSDFLNGNGECESKNFLSSNSRTARSIPGATAFTVAGSLSPAWFAWTCTSLAYWTTCALVKMRLPLITVPLAVISFGSFFVQGLLGSGRRRVAKIFTTEFSTAFEGVAAGDKTGEGFTSGVGVTGGGLGSAGAASAAVSTRQKIGGTAEANVMAKASRDLRSIIIRQRNSIRERKRASFFWIGDGSSRHRRSRNVLRI